MKEQVDKLKQLGVRAVFVGDACSEDYDRVHAGYYQLVFMSPESLLTSTDWREMLQNPVYETNLVGLIVDEAHCVKKW